MKKRILALILALVCLVDVAPFSVFATELEETEPVSEAVITEVTEEAPSEESIEPETETSEEIPQAESEEALPAAEAEEEAPAAEPEVIPEAEPATDLEETVIEDEAVPTAENSCGENLTWTLAGNGVLTVSGTGDMVNYGGAYAYPWFAQQESITAVIIEEGVLSIGNYAFAQCKNMTALTVHAGGITIGEHAFTDCTALADITFQCDAPEGICGNSFTAVTAAAHYPADNATWTADFLLNYGGTLSWDTECPGGHSYIAAVTPATCTADGYVTYTCSKCGDSYTGDPVPAAGHNFVEGICTSCGETLEAPVIAVYNDSKGNVVVIWTPVENAVSYNVYYAPSAEGPFQLAENTTEARHVDSVTPVGQMQYYAVTAVYADGFESTLSNADPLSRYPAAPDVTISNVASSGKIRLTWEPVEGAVSYRIYRATSKDGKYTLKYTSTGTGYTNTGAVVGTQYYYYVVAVSAAGHESEPSDIVTRTCDMPRPVVTATNNEKTGKVLLTWEPIDGAISYNIYRSTSKDSGFKKVYSVTGTSYGHSSGTPGVTYYYKVVAVNANTAANSAASAVKARMVDCAQPTVTVAVNAQGKPQVDWKSVDGAVSYKIYRAESPNGPWRLKYTSTSNSYANTGAEIGKTYYYKIKAVPAHNSGASSFSNVGSAKAVKNVYQYVYSTYSTSKPNGTAARNNNLAVACRAINGTILAPGETFSFNEVVGKRTPGRGYQIAPTGNGEAYGGGICQVSTTMFNTALLGNMKITRRSQHRSAATYVPKGRDAMIYTTKNDFRFVNDSDYYIKIRAKASGGTVTITFLTRESGVSPRSDVKLRVTRSGKTYTLTRTFQGVVNYTAKSTY